jgi:hypothetical protein
MRRQYLHLSAYSCERCTGPVIAGSMAVRENEISKETDVRQVGAAMCLSCGHRPSDEARTRRVRHFSPVEWEPADAINFRPLTSAFKEALKRADLH